MSLYRRYDSWQWEEGEIHLISPSVQLSCSYTWEGGKIQVLQLYVYTVTSWLMYSNTWKEVEIQAFLLSVQPAWSCTAESERKQRSKVSCYLYSQHVHLQLRMRESRDPSSPAFCTASMFLYSWEWEKEEIQGLLLSVQPACSCTAESERK